MQRFEFTSDQRKALINAAHYWLHVKPNEPQNPALKNALTKLRKQRDEARKQAGWPRK